MKKLIYLSFITLYFSLSYTVNSQTLVSHDFNDGELIPYETRKADQRERVLIKSGAVETHWKQSAYNGTNTGRKAQFMPIGDPQFTQHIWMGMSIKIGSDYMKDNTNTNAGLMQVWGYNGVSGAANHMCILKFDGRNGGALVWQHRYNSVANKTNILIQDNFPREQFVDVIIHVQLKNKNEGIVQVWVDGELKVNAANQTIGWGDQDDSGMINGTYCYGTSYGQYNYFVDAGYDQTYDSNNHLFDGHMIGETRTVTYDNMSQYNGVDGYDLVNPTEILDIKDVTEPLNSFSVFPNPANNKLTIKLNTNYSKETTIVLYAINGKKVLEQNINGEEINLDISKLDKGIYILMLQGSSGVITEKIVKL